MVRAEASPRLRLRPLSPARRYTFLDVFTDTPLSGNGLAVVHDADGIGDAAMLAFARETRLSETTFVQSPTREGADYRNRIWTMSGELPFAGHPSLGTAVAVARARGETEARYVQETAAGLQPVEVRAEGDRASASMLQEPAEFGREIDREQAFSAVGLTPDHGHPDLGPQIVSTGVPQLIVPVAQPAALAEAGPDRAALAALLESEGAVVLYLAWCDPPAGQAHARAFWHRTDDMEDPATGSAAGPLLAYLAARTGTEELVIAQGVEMGRPSRLEARLDGDRVRVGGDSVVVIDGEVHL